MCPRSLTDFCAKRSEILVCTVVDTHVRAPPPRPNPRISSFRPLEGHSFHPARVGEEGRGGNCSEAILAFLPTPLLSPPKKTKERPPRFWNVHANKKKYYQVSVCVHTPGPFCIMASAARKKMLLHRSEEVMQECGRIFFLSLLISLCE